MSASKTTEKPKPSARTTKAVSSRTPAKTVKAVSPRVPAKTVKAAPRAKVPRVPAAGARAGAVLAALRTQHPEAHCELVHASPWTLLVATVLSAQTTDKLVNAVTPSLFEHWPSPAALAAADPAQVGEHLRSRGMGFYNVKSRSIVGLARAVLERHGGEVPRTMAEMVKLPGVGRKTANLVLGECFGAPDGVVVDTHVLRLAQRLGLTRSTTPEETEVHLAALYPRDQWMSVTHTLIFHGRRVCLAVKPACASCAASALCPSAFDAVHVGRKALAARG